MNCSYILLTGFSSDSGGREPTCQKRRHKRHGFDSWVRKIPWRRAWQPILVCLPEECHGQKSLAGYSPQGCNELDTTEATQHACMLSVFFLHCKHVILNFIRTINMKEYRHEHRKWSCGHGETERVGHVEAVALTYIHYCVKQVTSWKLLYNTGSPPWCSVTTQWVEWEWGGKLKREGIYMCIYIHIHN